MKIQGIDLSEEMKMMRGVGGVRPRDIAELDKTGPGKTEKMSFGEFLSKQFEEVNHHGVEAEKAIQRAVAGEEVNPHSTMIAVQKARVSLTLMMSIKERLERTYQELLRMQIG
jgi:flagellar hook-basal body complex protein FliE